MRDLEKKEEKKGQGAGNSVRKGEKNVGAARLVVLGAVCGDMIGSCYEFHTTKDVGFELFTRWSRCTDDSVCTVAVADAILQDLPFDVALRYWCLKYPRAGYGGSFRRWIVTSALGPYNSWGNGSAMRVSPAGAWAHSLDDALRLAWESAEVTHNHPEGIKGAQAVAAAIFLALTGHSKQEIKEEIVRRFGYDLDRRYEDIQPDYSFDVSCQGSVPEAIICFLKSEDYESAVRLAVAMGGDADTMGAIAGSIAAAYYGRIPEHILREALPRIPKDMMGVIEEFNARIG